MRCPACLRVAGGARADDGSSYTRHRLPPGTPARRCHRRLSRLPAAKRAGCAYVVLDGTLIPVDRVARDKPFYSGKHKRHGMNL
jgi:hypothetical protein